MKCWYHFCFLSTAAVLIIGIKICRSSNVNDEPGLLEESTEKQVDLDLISKSMLKLTLIDENGDKLEQDTKSFKAGIPFQDATNLIKFWPKPTSRSKSSQAELGLENDSNIFTRKVITKKNGHSILKSLRKSTCQRQIKETDDCKTNFQSISEASLNENRPNNPASLDDTVDGKRSGPPGNNFHNPGAVSKPPITSRTWSKPPDDNNEKDFDSKNEHHESASFIIVEDEVDGPRSINSNSELQGSNSANDELGLPAKFRDQLSLPDCSDRVQDERFPILVVSTLDGQISGIDYKNGAVLWSHPTGDNASPLLSSSMSKIEVASRGEWVRLIPSLDGGIYRFDGENVEALPVTADTLLHSSFKFNEDTLFTGGKDTELIGISPFSGDVIYACNSTGCVKKFSTTPSKELLVIRRVSQTVRAIDPKTGNERWNFSVGQHEVNVANTGCESLSTDVEFDKKLLPPLQFVLPEGLIIGIDKNSQMLWRQKMASPIVSAWNLVKENLEKIDLFSSKSVPALMPEKTFSDDAEYHDTKSPNRQPSLYVGVHQKQLYIQQNGKTQNEFTSVIQRYSNTATHAADLSLPKVQWQPYLATAYSRTPVIHHEANKHPLLLDYDRKQQHSDLVVKHKSDYPFDNGYFLFGDESSVLNDSDHWDRYEDEDDEFYPDFNADSVTNQLYYICFQYGPNTLWKLGAGIIAYGIFHVMFVRYLISLHVERMRNYLNERAMTTLRATLHSILRENPQILAIIRRLGILELPPPPPAPTDALPNNSGQPSPPDPLPTSSTESTETLRQDSSFSSRYTSDFEPISCLGKGGFGVVFQVKNTLDENEYAIKRIILPKKESSAERVKREARALAKLNHTHIVRYYQSWLETPPVGWEQENDVWWKQSDAASSLFLSPDVDETHEKNFPHSIITDAVKKGKTDNTLSEIINKLSLENFPDAAIRPKSKNSVETSSDCSSEDSESSGDSDSEEEGETVPSTSYGDDDDDDSYVVFQADPLENNNSKSSFSINEDSIVFQDNTCHRKVESIEESCCDQLECRSLEIPRNEVPSEKIEDMFFKPKIRPKSDSTASGGDKELKRRRVKSYCVAPKIERPSFLDLTSASDPGHSKLVQQFAKAEATPNPRTYLYIQMELCQKESLKEWLANNLDRDLIYDKILNFFNDIVQAVEYVHDRALMHRDLKPSNIFFSLDGEIKVGDFGLVTTIEEENVIVLTPMDNFGPKKSDDLNQSLMQRTLNAGTHLYMSPEQMSGIKYNYKIDIFSLGLIFFEMLVPFGTVMERNEVMTKARNRVFPEGFQEKYQAENDLLQIALHNNPEERPTTRGIRARSPLASLQRDLESISPNEHFCLAKVKGHWRSHSGSFTYSHSSSVSSN